MGGHRGSVTTGHRTGQSRLPTLEGVLQRGPGQRADDPLSQPTRCVAGTLLAKMFLAGLCGAPRLDRVGTILSDKVLLMDGMRFFEYSDPGSAGSNLGELDFDATLPGGTYGAFYDSPGFIRSHAWGPRRDLASGASRAPAGATAHLKLSFRHNDGVNAAFFDGSVRYLKRRDVYERIDYFYPSNSIFTGADAVPEAAAKYTVGRQLP
jgi:prepilin-type processing-associated H-X9-DG protein